MLKSPDQSSDKLQQIRSHFFYRHGRRYLSEAREYPLPVDLHELNRQSLRTLLMTEVFGAPFCCNPQRPPKKILEIACGSAFWSSQCHDYLKSQGQDNVSFTGLDLAPIAPDLRKHGVNWKFVQHDLRKPPMPFNEGEFDLIKVNDAMVVFAAHPNVTSNPLGDLKKYLKPGGFVEIWEADMVFRCLLPEPFHAPGMAAEDMEQARKTATYTISASTPFVKAQNKYLQDCNHWLEAGLQRLDLSAAPCAVLGYSMSTEAAEAPDKVGSRRIAIPFSPFRFESEDVSNRTDQRPKPNDRKSRIISNSASSNRTNVGVLNPEQSAIRRTALNVTIGLIEGLEPLLKEQSGMKQDEWDRWWSNMTADLLEKDGTANGECLEIGAWWVER